jgi:hypothetical protein
MRRFRTMAERAGSGDTTKAPSVRYVYDRPLPYARHLRVEILDPDGAVVSTLVSSFEPGKGWVTQNAAIGSTSAA